MADGPNRVDQTARPGAGLGVGHQLLSSTLIRSQGERVGAPRYAVLLKGASVRRTFAASFGLVLTVSLILTACGDNGHFSRPIGPERHHMGGGMHRRAESTPVTDGARRIEVIATNFDFDPEEIFVTAGEDVAIVLTSRDLLHDFTIDDIEIHVTADRGETAVGGFRADRPGEYVFYCTIAGHRRAGMEGTLIVTEP